MNLSVVIVGGGIGGLFCGALLAKNGCRVTVLEKNNIPGGGLQCFHRRGKIFETGMHVVGGMEDGGSLLRICRYLGIADSLNIHHIRRDITDEIFCHQTGETIRIGSGKDNFISSLAAIFPEESANLEAYVNELYRITTEVPLFYLKESPIGLATHSDNFSIAADRLIATYISNPKLRSILAYLNPLYGGVEGHSPAYVHALISVLYINGAARFIGGSQQLADSLIEVIRQSGGEVLTEQEVTEIMVHDRRVTHIETASGLRFTTDWCIAAIHPATMLSLVPEGTFLRGFTKRLNSIPNTYSAFALFIDLKPGTLQYIDHTCYYLEDYPYMWKQSEFDPTDWPKGFMYMTPPDANQGIYASRLLVHSVMQYDNVRRWENTSSGNRGDDYEQWKRSMSERIISKLEHAIPGIRKCIAHCYTASPLTIRDYYHTKEGAIFGYRKDCDDPIFSQLPVYTKVTNLLLTGQNINLHGICGVPLTAVTTAEAILGHNFLINQLDSDNKKIN